MNSNLFKFAEKIATLYGLGYRSKMPGTLGAIATLPVAFVINYYGGYGYLIFFTLAIFLLGIWAADIIITTKKSEDDPAIIIDEVAGQSLLLWFAPLSLSGYIFALILFRIFDIFKPFPINWFDANIKGGKGCMLDDIVAAIIACPIMILWRLYGF